MATRVAPLCAVLALGAAAPARAEAAADVLIVARAPALGDVERAALRERADVLASGRVPGLPGVDLVVPEDGDRGRALAALREDPAVRWAEAAVPRRVAADARQAELWGLENTGQSVPDFRGTPVAGTPGADSGAVRAWAATRGAGVTIAVVDTGAALTHPDLAPQLAQNPGERDNGLDDDGNRLVDDVRGWDFAADDNDPQDGNGHGTHVAGTAAAAPGGGDVVGVAPEARLLVLQALGADGSGWSYDTAAAFAYAGARGAKVVNVSLESSAPSGAELAAIRAYPDTLYVVAAGNGGADGADGAGDDNDGVRTSYPCAYDVPNVLCVGASTQQDAPAAFSNFGAASVDLFAPGENILSTWLAGGYDYADGTSMASPHAAGAAALVASAHPGWTAAQIKTALIGSAAPRPALAGRAVSGGRLDAAAALGWIPPAPAPAPAPATLPAQVAPAAAPVPVPVRAVPGPLTVTRLRVTGGCRPACRAARAALAFTASRAGSAAVLLERRARGRYRRAATGTLTVTPGAQRVPLRTRVAGVRLRAGRWRVTLAGARVAFRVS